MIGCVFSLEEFSVFDGPGIRTSVFLKGCPLTCSWCHNPEGQNPEPQIVRSPNGCIGCNACIRSSVYKDGALCFTDESIKNCPRNLLRVCGEYVDSEELCQRLLKNSCILNNGGGVTFSGGEPLLQSGFLFECLSLLSGRLHTAIQTSGYCSRDCFAGALELADYFLFDLKLAYADDHKRYTGVTNDVILENFSALAKSGREFVVRIPLIPGVTDTVGNITGLSEIIRANGVKYAEVLPYNKMAGGKYKMLQRRYNPGFDESAEVLVREDIFNSFGIEIRVL